MTPSEGIDYRKGGFKGLMTRYSYTLLSRLVEVLNMNTLLYDMTGAELTNLEMSGSLVL